MLKEVSQRLKDATTKGYQSKALELHKSSFMKRKNPEMVGVNPMKIEAGLIKFEYSNKFNLRVNNYRRADTGISKKAGAFSGLERFVHDQNLIDA